jgi:muramidase (phage lysozyme)
LRCIRWHESRGDYQAFNGVEHYGAYQLSATYSDDWARKYGYGEWANVTADQWPPSVQDAVAVALFADWRGAWSTLGSCI